MLLSEILKKKARQVVAIDHETTCGSILSLLRSYHIGVVVLTADDRSIIGMISERDILRAIADYGDHVLDWRSRQIATRSWATCNLNDTVTCAMLLMTREHTSHLAIADEGDLIGVITIGDILKHQSEEMKKESRPLRDVSGATTSLAGETGAS